MPNNLPSNIFQSLSANTKRFRQYNSLKLQHFRRSKRNAHDDLNYFISCGGRKLSSIDCFLLRELISWFSLAQEMFQRVQRTWVCKHHLSSDATPVIYNPVGLFRRVTAELMCCVWSRRLFTKSDSSSSTTLALVSFHRACVY